MNYYWSFLVSRIKFGEEWVLYNWLNGENVTLTDRNHPAYQQLEEKKVGVLPFKVNDDLSDFNYLVENKFLVLSQESVRQEVRGVFNDVNDDSKLGLILMPANMGCNFRCTYCWEEHSPDNMMGDLELEAICKYIAEKTLTAIHIEYFGGEPLLNLEFIKKFGSRLVDIAVKNNFLLEPSSMSTNGYLLTKEVFLSLHALGINSYQITLDGEAVHHNALRPHVDGSGTHAVIYQNLIDMADTEKDFNVTIRINFDPDSASTESREKYLKRLAADFGNDSRFIFNPIPITKISNSANQSVNLNCCNDDERLSAKKMFEDGAEALGLRAVRSILPLEVASRFCYAGRSNSFIAFPINESGKMPLKKCTLCLTSGHNEVGSLGLDGQLTKNDSWAIWTKENLFKAEKCKNCFLVLQCFGNACAHHNLVDGEAACPSGKFQERRLVERLMKSVNEA